MDSISLPHDNCLRIPVFFRASSLSLCLRRACMSLTQIFLRSIFVVINTSARFVRIYNYVVSHSNAPRTSAWSECILWSFIMYSCLMRHHVNAQRAPKSAYEYQVTRSRAEQKKIKHANIKMKNNIYQFCFCCFVPACAWPGYNSQFGLERQGSKRTTEMKCSESWQMKRAWTRRNVDRGRSVDDGPEQMNSKFAPLLGRNLGRAREIIYHAIWKFLLRNAHRTRFAQIPRRES